jgi:hypothetical protein
MKYKNTFLILPIIKRPAQIGQAFRRTLTVPSKHLQDFWYNHPHNKNHKEEPKEDKAADKKQLPPQRWSILLREELPIQPYGQNC